MATLRHKRGYAFERYIVKNINDDKWDSRILGGASTGLPDVVVTNNFDSILFSIEAKSTVGNKLNIPQDEFIRCAKILTWLKTYEKKYIVLAFKFGSGKVKEGKAKRKKGEERFYYFKVLEHMAITNLNYIYCNIDGEIWWTKKDKDGPMPKILFAKYLSIDSLKEISSVLEFQSDINKDPRLTKP